MVRCWALSLKERPSFTEIVQALVDLPSNSKVWADKDQSHPSLPKSAGVEVPNISGTRTEEERTI